MRFSLPVAVAIFLIAAATVAMATPHIMTMPYRSNLRISPFSSLSQPTFGWIDGATVSIDVGYSPGFDRLFFDYEGKFPITATFNDATGVLSMTGVATSSEYTDAIASVVFFTTAAAGARRQISYSLGANTFYLPLTEHYYRFFESPGITWTASAGQCSTSSFFGMPGYLATISSQDEQSSLSYVSTFDAWIGGNDIANFGTYTWVVGPEQGNVIWTGQSIYAGGVAPENVYTAWNRFQPENPQGSGQDYMYLVNSADQATSYWAVASDNSYVSGYICEYGAPNQTQTVQLAGGSIELVFSCGLFTSSDDCAAESSYGCQWSVSTGQCVQSLCSKFNSQTSCVADSKCSWDTTGEIGVCTNTQCASLTAAVCTNNPVCMVASDGVTCRPAYCSERTSPCDCTNQDGCLWRNGKCGSSTMIDCNGMDVVFVVDASAEMANPYGRYPQGFFGVMQALLETDFYFNGNTSGTVYPGPFAGTRVGITTFGMSSIGVVPMTSNRAQFKSGIQGLQQTYSSAAIPRNIRDSLTAALNMFDGALNRTRVVVVLSAGGIVDAKQIRNEYTNTKLGLLGSFASLGIVIIGGAMESSSAGTINGVNAAASLAYLTDGTPTAIKTTTISMLIPQLFNGMCIGTSLSQYLVPGKVSIQCDAIEDQTVCDFNRWCAWDPSAGLCKNNLCLGFCNSATCEANDACAWQASDSACVAKCPALGKDDCLATSTCSWDYPTATCHPAPCVTNPSEDACIADGYGCTWFASNSTPCQVTPCQTADATSCAASYGCVFNGQDCVQDPCHTLLDSVSCATLPQCGWNQDAALCQRNQCGMHATERQCATDFNCVWNMSTSPAACGPRMCTSFNQDPSTAQVMCSLNLDQCYWQTSGQTPRCVVRACELMTTSSDCASVDNCLWRNNTCQQDSFAQCPPTDIVFLVEATPVMNSAFGRHPNGYIGIVEAIREWSQKAPYAWALGAPGFRFALVTYGQGLPLYVPFGIGGGGNFTTSSTQWVGAGQELDWNEDNEKAYSTSGQSGSVSLRPALQQAISVFNTELGASERKKLVVILGNSPITDGGSAMLKQITQLETMGVKIFANILRRFSYVTELDTTAEDYMRPIASDPPSTFFSFTTIDTMTESLLNAFCDPSSKTGKFLEVSRNGELPCSWLTGADECNIQGTCAWNPNAVKQCPQSGQCPTLGCVALPTALANQYTCDQCQLVSGAISCSRSNPPAVEKGLCQVAACTKTAQANCNSATCEFVDATQTCERHVCSLYLDLASCNTQAGCVWEDTWSSGTCIRSPCGRLRDTASCTTYMSATPAGYGFLACFVNKTVSPNICMSYRCPMLKKDTCPSGASSPCLFNEGQNICGSKVCQYPSAELCDLDATCYWDWYHGQCQARTSGCALAPYSDWTPCSATCGNAYTYKTRAILQFPTGGESCPQIASRGCYNERDMNVCASTDKSMTIIQTCTAPPNRTNGTWIPANPSVPKGEWPTDCAVHCASYTVRMSCMRDSSCEWDGLKCVETRFPGCKAFWTRSDCLTSDMCAWDDTYGVCTQTMEVCPYTTQQECSAVSYCAWRTGSNAQVLANSMNIPLQLVNPGQTPIFPFSTVASTDETVISGATITIESNYQRGKDVLVATFTNKTSVQWIDAAGTLMVSGLATVSEYLKTIRFISFSTTSTRTVPRTITWSLGNNTVFSSATMNHYKVITNAGATYGFAEADCARRTLYGLQGYLATITSQSENDLVSMKLFGDGWISGGDASGNWKFTSGPQANSYAFWSGKSVSLGGYSVDGHFSNWSPPNQTNTYGEPIVSATGSGNERVYLAQTGYWEARSFDTTNTNGYICEFGGMKADVPPTFPIGGAMMVGIGGCVAANCLWHATESMCAADIECTWRNGVCQLGCSALATQADCSSNSLCRWNTAILPPICDVDPCASLAQTPCQANLQCHWSATKETCSVQTGCGLFISQTTCKASPGCYWSVGSCLDRGCGTFESQTECRAVAKCRWDDATQLCADQFCLFTTEAMCNTDSTRCDWNLPEDSRTMTFTPKTGTAYPFQANVDPCADVSTQVNGITVAITAGMQANADVLSIDPSVQAANNYAVTYDGVTGIMKITVNIGTYVTCSDAFNFMADAVQFSTSSSSALTRTITYALQANTAFSSATQTYYTAVAYTPSSFADAQANCAAMSLFGMPGSLAVLTSEGDAQLVTQLGIPGWIAASSDASGLWSWNNPSGTKTAFWNGTGALGAPLPVPGNATQDMFSQWDMGEPSMPSSYGYVSVTGYWKAVLPGSSSGIVCQFGSPSVLPTATIGGFRKAAPGGCFVSMCKSLGVSQCVTNGQCKVANGACAPDTRCQAGQTISECAGLALCYWDYSQQACLAQQPDGCNKNGMGACLNSSTACRWDPTLVYAGQSTSGFCVSRGCAAHPAASPCKADPLCLWNSVVGNCYPRLCGWTTESQCWADPLCEYQRTAAFTGCARSPCAGYPQSTCAQHDSCGWVSGQCVYQRCTTTLGISVCLEDVGCVFVNGKCTKPNCNSTLTQASCAATPNCYFSIAASTCLASQCSSYTTESQCTPNADLRAKNCTWDSGVCRQAIPADAAAVDTCVKQANGNMWWLWIFAAIILVLLGMILHRLYLAYAGSGNIFEPTRRNYKYNPHERYAAAIVDDAAKRGDDTNIAEVL